MLLRGVIRYMSHFRHLAPAFDFLLCPTPSGGAQCGVMRRESSTLKGAI